MVKIKLFPGSKKKEETYVQENTTRQESKEKHTATPNKEYNETLYSKGFAQKQTITPPPVKQPLRRTTWENAETIEQNIDNMRQTQSKSTSSQVQTGIDTEKKVDYILFKKKK